MLFRFIFTYLFIIFVSISQFAFADIKTTQKYLNAFGYNPGVADGIWGNKTENAIKSFLSDAGVPWDGKFDDNEFALIEKDFLATPNYKRNMGSIPTSTDLRFANVCNGIETNKAYLLWGRMRRLEKRKNQSWSNIGIDQILDLHNDGSLEAVAINFSVGQHNRFIGKTIKFSSTNHNLKTNSIEGMTFLNEQPDTKEIRKITQGDLNSDGIIDMVFFDYGEHDGQLKDGKIIALLSQEGSYVWNDLGAEKGTRIHTGTLMDIDDDGDLDVVYGTNHSHKLFRNTILALKNEGNGNFSKARTPAPNNYIGTSWVSFNANDIDGDGHHDLIVEYAPDGNKRVKRFGVQIFWGSEPGIFKKINITRVKKLDNMDLLMDSIAVNNGDTTDIYATFAEDNYQTGSKIIKYTFKGRNKINEVVIASSSFKTSNWINTVYPCKSGLKVFMMAGNGSTNILDQMR